MEALIVLLLVFLAVVLFVFPLWAFIKIRAHSEELDWLRDQVQTLETELRRRPSAAAAPVADKTPAVPATAQPLSTAAPAATTGAEAASRTTMPAVTPPLQPAPMPAPAVPTPTALPIPSTSGTTPPPLPPTTLPQPSMATTALPPKPAGAEKPRTAPVYVPPARPKPALNLEQFMGVRLFAWLGGLALFLGAVFFVKLSIEQDWIPREVRVALGFLLGAGLIVGGVLVSRRKYEVTAQTLCATGIVTLYAITFSCRSIYHFEFFGVIPTFVLMVLITATAFLLAVRMEAKLVAILGMLGGFLTPMLLSTGQDNPPGLFGYIALLDIGLIAVALHRRWHFLVPLGALCTGGMQVGWAAKFLDNSKTLTAIIVCLVFDALFLGAFAFAQRRKQASSWLMLPVAGLVFLSFGFAWYLGAETTAGLQPLRWMAFVFLADLCILTMVTMEPSASRLHAFAGMAVFALLGMWTYSRLNADLLGWALGSYLLFAAVHSAFPLVLQRLRPDAVPDSWHQFFAPLTLLLVLGPVLNSPHASMAIWPAILLIDVIAIIIAWMTASVAGVVAVLILTLFAAGQSFLRLPLSASGNGLLLVVAGFAVLFFVFGLALTKRLRTSAEAGAPLDDASQRMAAQLPILSALLPFVLLVMATARLQAISPHPIFGLTLLLVVLTLGLAKILNRGALTLAALAGTLAVIYVWLAEQFQPAVAAAPLGWTLAFYAIFTAFPFYFRKQFADSRSAWIASALAGPTVFPAVFGFVNRGWPNDVMGLLPAMFAIPALICVVAVLRLDPVDHPRRLGRLALFGGVALLFITLIFPIQFERQWITLAWALEGVALLWMFHRVPHRGVPIAGVLLLVVAFVRLSANPAVFDYQPRSATPILNWYLYTYGAVTVCLLVGARLLAPPRERVLRLNAPLWLNSLAGILLFLLVNIEIADYFSTEYTRLAFDFSGNFARDMSYTIAWALYALGLLVVGIWKKLPGARYAAIGLLAVTLIKLFFHDLARLAAMYKIGALMVVAVVAILTSFLYQRFVPADEKPSDAPDAPDAP